MQARRLPARHGFLWLMAGFRLFRANPPLLTALTLGYLFLVIAVNLLPMIGPFLVPLALPTLAVVVANGCRAIELGRNAEGNALTYGLQQHRVALVRLGGLHLLGSVIILAISLAVEGGQLSFLGPDGSVDEEEMFAAMARLVVIALPIMLAFWFAPLLTAWDGVPATKAVFFSLVAGLSNWRSFVVYGLSVGLVAILLPGLLLIAADAVAASLRNVIALALKMLLIFVMAPTLMASVYLSYQDVFHGPDEPG